MHDEKEVYTFSLVIIPYQLYYNRYRYTRSARVDPGTIVIPVHSQVYIPKACKKKAEEQIHPRNICIDRQLETGIIA